MTYFYLIESPSKEFKKKVDGNKNICEFNLYPSRPNFSTRYKPVVPLAMNCIRKRQERIKKKNKGERLQTFYCLVWSIWCEKKNHDFASWFVSLHLIALLNLPTFEFNFTNKSHVKSVKKLTP